MPNVYLLLSGTVPNNVDLRLAQRAIEKGFNKFGQNAEASFDYQHRGAVRASQVSGYNGCPTWISCPFDDHIFFREARTPECITVVWRNPFNASQIESAIPYIISMDKGYS